MRPIGVFFLMIISMSGFCQENLAIGQDLNAYLKDNPPTFKIAGPTIIGIPEGKIDLYKYKAKTYERDIKILIILDKYAVGVLQSENGTPHFLYDLTGDGILDTEVAGMEIPYWVMARNTEEKLITSTNNIKKYLDGYYAMFQREADPLTTGASKEYSDSIVKTLASGPIENRDLLFALYCCYRWGSSYPAGTIASVDYLAKSYFTRFRADHNLFYLQFLESYTYMGNKDDARRLMETLIALDPNYVPAQVYRWQLEMNADRKKAFFADLKSRHPNHWIVKQLRAD